MEMDESINVFGEPLEASTGKPITGFFRDNMCNTCEQDIGSHTVCIKATQEFLEYSRFKGNDLSTPVPEFGFEGLAPGDRWCLCATRWLQAYEQNMAPKVHLTRTHYKALDIIPLAVLREYAADLN